MLHIKTIKPRHTSLITTGDKYEEDMKVNGVILAYKDSLKLYQKVVAIGPMVRDMQVGDTVMIDPSAYEVKKYDANSIHNDLGDNKTIRLELPWITMDDEEGKPKDYLLLDDRDIKYVFEGEEIEVSPEAKSNLILPKDKQFIVS